MNSAPAQSSIDDLLGRYDRELKPTPPPRFVDAFSVLTGYAWKEKQKTVIFEFYSTLSQHWYEPAVGFVQSGRLFREALNPNVKHLEFNSFDMGTSDEFTTIAMNLVDPPIVHIPTYICFEDGIEVTNEDGSPKRLEIKDKPADACELGQMIREWIITLGF